MSKWEERIRRAWALAKETEAENYAAAQFEIAYAEAGPCEGLELERVMFVRKAEPWACFSAVSGDAASLAWSSGRAIVPFFVSRGLFCHVQPREFLPPDGLNGKREPGAFGRYWRCEGGRGYGPKWSMVWWERIGHGLAARTWRVVVDVAGAGSFRLMGGSMVWETSAHKRRPGEPWQLRAADGGVIGPRWHVIRYEGGSSESYHFVACERWDGEIPAPYGWDIIDAGTEGGADVAGA